VTSVGTTRCTSITLKSSVKTNSAEPAVLAADTGTASGCTGDSLTEEIKSIAFEPIEFHASTHTDNGSRLKFTYNTVDVTTHCFLEGPVLGTWMNGSISTDVTMNLTGGGGGLRPASSTLKGDFALNLTSSGTAVTVNG
jgi:hypothetical protein